MKRHLRQHKEVFKTQSVIIDEDGYKVSPRGAIHRIAYFHYHPSTPRKWHVHHIDCNKLNNSLDNLIALPPEVHFFIHNEIARTKRIITRPEFQAYIDQFYKSKEIMDALNAQIDELEKRRNKIASKYYRAKKASK